MRIIPVATYPLKQSYKTPQQAIEGAKNHPGQPQAIADSGRLHGTTIVDASWTDAECAVRFSNGLIVHIVAVAGDVEWLLRETTPHEDEAVGRVGEEPVVLRWKGPPLRDSNMDRSTLAAKRRGAEFKKLFVNEFGLHVVCKNLLIWCFGSVRRTDLDLPFLYVCESD